MAGRLAAVFGFVFFEPVGTQIIDLCGKVLYLPLKSFELRVSRIFVLCITLYFSSRGVDTLLQLAAISVGGKSLLLSLALCVEKNLLAFALQGVNLSLPLPCLLELLFRAFGYVRYRFVYLFYLSFNVGDFCLYCCKVARFGHQLLCLVDARLYLSQVVF